MINRILKLNFIYLLSLGIFSTIFYGLIVNTILPSFGILSPLSATWVWPVYTLYLLPLYKLVDQTREWLMDHTEPFGLKLLIVLNPFLAVMGANYVNNGGEAAIAIISILIICLNFTWIMIRSKDDTMQNDSTHKAFLYSAALSLIYAFALRSNYLSGYDIHQEFQVFKLTSEHNIWSMDTLRDAYNACLSITILPTIIRNLTGLSELVVFRVVYPLILAMIPVGVYTIGTRFLSNKLAYSGAFLFLIQAQYFNQLPALLRQGVAFLFFALLVDSLIRRDVARKYTQLSVLVFGTGIVLSHYSTTYTTIAVLILAKLAITMGELFVLRTRKTTILSIWILAYLIGITLLWNVIITDTAGGLTSTLSKVTQNISTIFSLENKSDTIKAIFYKQVDNNVVVNNYNKQVLANSSNPERYSDYIVKPITINNGKNLSLRNPIVIYFHIIIPWLYRLMIICGFIVLLIQYGRYYYTISIVALSAGMIGISLMLIVLPSLSVSYNFERLFQQMLIILSPIALLGIDYFIKRIKFIQLGLVIIMLCLSYLIQTTGLAARTFFNVSTWIFDNGGETYYRYYSSEGEISGIAWLNMHTSSGSTLYMDKYSRLRTLAYSDRKSTRITSEVNPPVIQDNAYVLEGFAATKAKVVFSDVRNIALRFTFPLNFVNEYANIIYSNNSTRIYK